VDSQWGLCYGDEVCGIRVNWIQILQK